MAASAHLFAEKVTLSVALAPSFRVAATDAGSSGHGGVRDALGLALRELLVKYHAGLRGVLLAYSRVRFASKGPYTRTHTHAPIGRIVDEYPYVHVRVSMDALVFRPSVGAVLYGGVQTVTSGHVGVLVGGLFNASLHADDLAHGYGYDEAKRGWVRRTPARAAPEEESGGAAASAGAKRLRSASVDEAVGVMGGGGDAGGVQSRTRAREAQRAAELTRMLAEGNPEELRVGSTLSFFVRSVSYSNGLMTLFGSLDAAACTGETPGAKPATGAQPATAQPANAQPTPSKAAVGAAAPRSVDDMRGTLNREAGARDDAGAPPSNKRRR